MQRSTLNLQRLLVYRNLLSNHVIRDFCGLVRQLDNPALKERRILESTYFDICYKLLQNNQKQNLNGNVWRNYILNLIASDENIFSLSCEKSAGSISPSIHRLAIHDLQILKELYAFDWAELGQDLGLACPEVFVNYEAGAQAFSSYPAYYNECLHRLKVYFKVDKEPDALFNNLAQFYNTVGTGVFGPNIAFKWDHGLQVIGKHDPVELNDLVGYQYQKVVITNNTEAFLAGRKANHVILYGNKGTGKSSMVKALLNQYAKSGLRMIEIPKHKLAELGQILLELKHRGYYFIIFIDDFSFEDFEVEYKYVKSVIEGSLEATPDNVLIYVTSNRRHLIRENWSDRRIIDQEVHAADTEQEKLSLADRFGITLSFESPAQEQYLQIVTELALRNGLIMDNEELRRGALQWERKTHGRSGRTARQYINHLIAINQTPYRPGG